MLVLHVLLVMVCLELLIQLSKKEVVDNDIYSTAVLSGNRNFDGRIHPYVKEAFLASPALVVAYALAGSIRFDIETDSLGTDSNGNPITLKDLWPTDEEINAVEKAQCVQKCLMLFMIQCSLKVH